MAKKSQKAEAMDDDERQRQMRISDPRVAEIVTIEGRKAYARADAWARSMKGTPYGAKEPKTEVR